MWDETTIEDAYEPDCMWAIKYARGRNYAEATVVARADGSLRVYGQVLGVDFAAEFRAGARAEAVARAKHYARNAVRNLIVPAVRTRQTLVGLKRVLFARGSSTPLLPAGSAA